MDFDKAHALALLDRIEAVESQLANGLALRIANDVGSKGWKRGAALEDRNLPKRNSAYAELRALIEGEA